MATIPLNITKNQDYNNSFFFSKENFNSIINDPHSYELSEEQLNSFIVDFNGNLMKQNRLKFAFFILLLRKEYLFLKVLNDTGFSSYFLRMFFQLELFIILQNHNPKLVQNLILFQQRTYKRPFTFFDKQDGAHFQKTLTDIDCLTRDIIIKNIYDSFSSIILTLDIKNISEKTNSIAKLFSYFLIHIPNRYDSLFIRTIIESSTTFQETFYQTINNSNDNALFENFIPLHHHSTLTHLFTSPFLCSLAFKEGDSVFLPFCDIKEHIQTHPEYFS